MVPLRRGELDYAPDEFKQVVSQLDRMKFQVFIHSIGDRGIRTALDAIEYAEQQNGISQDTIPRPSSASLKRCRRRSCPTRSPCWKPCQPIAGG